MFMFLKGVLRKQRYMIHMICLVSANCPELGPRSHLPRCFSTLFFQALQKLLFFSSKSTLSKGANLLSPLT